MRRAGWAVLWATSLFCAFQGGRRWQQANTEREVVAWANGLTIEQRFLNKLNTLWESDALSLALDYRLVEDAARTQGIALTEPEIDKRVKQQPPGFDPEAIRETQRYLLLAKKLVLQRYDQKKKEQLWGTLRNDLALYKIRVVLFASQADQDAFWFAKPTAKNFNDLARRYNASSELALREGGLKEQSLASLRKLLGAGVAEELEITRVGELTASLDSKAGVLVALLESRRDSYKDLEPSLDDLLFSAGQLHLNYDLRNQGEVRTVRRLSSLSAGGTSLLNPLVIALERYNVEKETALLAFDPRKRAQLKYLKVPTAGARVLPSALPKPERKQKVQPVEQIPKPEGRLTGAGVSKPAGQVAAPAR